MYDLKIRSARIVDGSGRPARVGDIGIVGDRIVAVGEAPDAARRVLDGEGLLATPGFVDIHTHYDGQVTWDADLMPSSIHGVTTAVMGNCGVGFAPVRSADRQKLIDLMEGVEDIPGAVLSEGIRWRWETTEEYMDALAAEARAIDVAVQVPHDALRVWTMGERALRGEAASAEDIARMRADLRRALQAGAVGFSTGRSDNHRNKFGGATPAAEASAAELAGIAGAFLGLNHGVLMAVSDYDMEAGPQEFDREFDVVQAMAAGAPGHKASLSVSQRDLEPDQWRRIVARAEAANAQGLDIRLQVAQRGIGVLLGYEATFQPFMGYPSYKKIAHLPIGERVAILRQPEFRAQMLTEKNDKVAGDGSSIPPLADRMLAMLDRLAFKMFRLGTVPNYEPTLADSLGARARLRGVSALEEIYDALLEDDGRALLYFPIYNYQGFNLDVVGELLHHPLALPGLSDGGAHAGTICDASFSTFLLMHWTRDRPKGRLSIERAVQMLAADTSDYMGFADRGRLLPGLRADLNLIDIDGLALEAPKLVGDLPAGGKRLLQRARGYKATVVAGQVMLQDDELTGVRAGGLLRLGAG
ncbi:MAG: amidohydrolase family protein [Deltaproteobacteria bacterium]|nr:amidohydrolase family protein [Deltaproteobacteria bacterium]